MLILVAAFSALRADADGPAGQSVFVPVEPCRLFDYRPHPDQVGPRNTPLAPGETHVQQVTGTEGFCDVPFGATAVAMNVTAVFPTEQSNLKLFPADRVIPPTVSNLNFGPGQRATPNKVDVELSPAGQVKIQNYRGFVYVVGDVFGYYATGPLAELEAETAQLRTNTATVPSGLTITGQVIESNHIAVNDVPEALYVEYGVDVPAEPLLHAFSADSNTGAGDIVFPGYESAACTGSYDSPTAPPGALCLYLLKPPFGTANTSNVNINIDKLQVDPPNGVNDQLARSGFVVAYSTDQPAANTHHTLAFTWAYTAP